MLLMIQGRCLLLFLACFLSCAALVGAQSEETLLDGINQLPESERQARLVNGAKKEGAVTWYVAMNRIFAQELINAFEAQYPFLKVNALTGATRPSFLSAITQTDRVSPYGASLWSDGGSPRLCMSSAISRMLRPTSRAELFEWLCDRLPSFGVANKMQLRISMVSG
jgi:hypothetical protein